MTTQLIEKKVTVEDPRDGTPFVITVQLELNQSECECQHRTPSLGNPAGWRK